MSYLDVLQLWVLYSVLDNPLSHQSFKNSVCSLGNALLNSTVWGHYALPSPLSPQNVHEIVDFLVSLLLNFRCHRKIR